MKTQSAQCAHEQCSCPGLPEIAASKNEVFCSDGCADGVGCHHEDCNCADAGGTDRPDG
jgi:hypothetical protein